MALEMLKNWPNGILSVSRLKRNFQKNFLQLRYLTKDKAKQIL